MVYITIKVKKQLKRKGGARLDSYLESSQGWKLNFRRVDNVQTKSIAAPKVVNPYIKKKTSYSITGKMKK
jgi:hypothetical protein